MISSLKRFEETLVTFAGGVVLERCSTDGRVEPGTLVIGQRCGAYSSVPVRRIEKKRRVADSRVVAPCGIGNQRASTAGRVSAASRVT